MVVFDPVLNRKENVHEFVTGEKGVSLELHEPEEFKDIFDGEIEDED